MKKLLALVLAVLFGVSCYAQSSSRVVYALSPNMNCENCAARVQSALQALAGVDSVKTCLGAQTVEVVYNGASLKPEVIVQALAGIGYTATPAEKCVRASAGQCANGVAVSKEAAQKMQRIEQANPGIVTAIDGKATVREAFPRMHGYRLQRAEPPVLAAGRARRQSRQGRMRHRHSLRQGGR